MQIEIKIDEKCKEPKIIVVTDKMTDEINAVIQRLADEQPQVLAGFMEAKNKCDITISIDCDGQDDVNAMDEMIRQYKDGCEVVYGVRSKRETDSFFKRFTAQTFYKLLRWMGAEVVYNHADYRLISNRVICELENFKEVNIFLRGLIPLVGFKSTSVYYERNHSRARCASGPSFPGPPS